MHTAKDSSTEPSLLLRGSTKGIAVGWLFRGEAKITKNTEKGGINVKCLCLRFLPIHLNEDKPDR